MIANIDLIIRGISMSGEVPHIIDIRESPFNARPSSDSTGNFDAAPAINAAIEAYTLNSQNAYSGAAPIILIPPCDGYWYIASPIRVTRSCRIMGSGSGMNYCASRIKTATGIFAAFEIIADHKNGGPYAGGHGTIISNLSITPRFPAQVTRYDTYGIYSNTLINLAHVTIKDMGNDGVCIDASAGGSLGYDVTPIGNANGTMYGNATGWTMFGCRIDDCMGNGVRIVGDKSHGGSIYMVNMSGNHGCGVLDQSKYGCQVFSPHFGGCGFVIQHPTLTHTVTTAGVPSTQPRYFIAYQIAQDIEPGVTSGWEDYYYEFNKTNFTNTSNTQFEVTAGSLDDGRGGVWQAGVVYPPSGAYNSWTHDTSGAGLYGVYMEALRQGPVRIGSRATMFGGTCPSDEFRARGASNTSTIITQGAFNTLNVRGYDQNGKECFFGSDPANGNYLMWGNEADSTDGTPIVWSVKRDAAGSIKGYEFVHQSNTSQGLLRFERDGSNAPTGSIQELEDRIAALEALV